MASIGGAEFFSGEGRSGIGRDGGWGVGRGFSFFFIVSLAERGNGGLVLQIFYIVV